LPSGVVLSTYGVAVMNPDGRGRTNLGPGDPTDAAWSPDGRRIAFLALYGGLLVIDADGKHKRRLTGSEEDGSPVWSPDGKRLAYVTSNFRLVAMNADGRGRRSLGDGWDPAWAPDGRTIAYVADGPLGGSELRSIRPDGTGMRRLTSNYPDGVEPEVPVWLRG